MARFRNSRGGGVLMYVRNDIAVEVIDNLTGIYDSHESLFIRFNLRGFGQISYAQFKSYSVLLKYLLKYAKRNYYTSKKRFNKCKNSIKNKWNEINDLLGKNRTNNVTCLSVGDDEITDDIEIVETFNNYFSNVAVETAGLVGEPMNDYLNLLPNVQESFYIFPSTPDEVEKIISNLGSNNPLLDIPVNQRCFWALSYKLRNFFTLDTAKSFYYGIVYPSNIICNSRLGRRFYSISEPWFHYLLA
ncbi:hypothetical protein Avbf_17111 [Armadillidium vulgare]|nr:hypothetical protein Avbf_17111 [Armadillidium vulgare]